MENFQLRIIEYPINGDYKPLTTYGWNAAELVVRDTGEYLEIINSPFKIIGKPADLKMTKQIRACKLRA